MTGKPNRLIKEKSPYLLQHAYNPVDWYPWGEEAFTKAKLEDKPIFLSVGYSTCHWCHVMERESFEDHQVAEVLNHSFVAIKVDREERPDVDHIYMKACQLLTGQGGWPLTIIMTADKRPFFAGTYFPKRRKYGQPGMMEILSAVAYEWLTNRSLLLNNCEALTKAIMESSQESEGKASALTSEILDAAYQQLENNFDTTFGGFSSAPKFPTPHNLMFLLRYWRVSGKKNALDMVEKTLISMYQGGIYDHIGGGFSRYSTDEQWLVPHFEKMLYDNALLVIAYIEAYQCTHKQEYRDVVEKTVSYIKRDMMDGDGGFHSAEDADSEGIEGKYYLFTKQEVMHVLGEEKGKIFCAYYGVTVQGNFTPQQNIVNAIGKNVDDFAIAHKLSKDEVSRILIEGQNKLFALRKKRIPPHKDDKILTAWNALMIVSLAMAGRTLEQQEYITMATKAMQFIEKKLIDNNRVLVRYREAEAAVPGYIDDYAFLLWAYLELYQSTFEILYLKKAKQLASQMITLFFDDKNGGFFFTGSDVEAVLFRHKEIYDGAIPSGNSVAIFALQKLAKLTDDKELAKCAQKTVDFFTAKVQAIPEAYTFFLMAMMNQLMPDQQIVLAVDDQIDETKKMQIKIQQSFLPFTTIVRNDVKALQDIRLVIPYIDQYLPLNGQTTVYVCKEFHCLPPIYKCTDLAETLKTM